jgi:DNA-binding transcriptional regulator YiaG
MANLASILKGEIARVARREIRAELQGLKKSNAAHRSDIARLKRQIAALEQQVKRLAKGTSRGRPAASEAEEDDQRLRFSAKGLASQRKRLGLSAEAFGALIGASGQSVYKWESGKIRPRARLLPKIAELRRMGKREAAARLQALAA